MSFNQFCIQLYALSVRSLDLHHNFCCVEVRFQTQDQFWIPQPKLNWEKNLIFFVKSQNRLVTWFSRKGVFQRVFRHKIGPLSPNRCFSESDMQYERKSSKIGLFIEENRTRTKLSLVRANTIYRAHAGQLDFLKKLKNKFAIDPRHLRREFPWHSGHVLDSSDLGSGFDPRRRQLILFRN